MLRIFRSYQLKGYNLVGNLCQRRCKRKIIRLRLYRGNKEKWNLFFHPNLSSTRFHATYILFLYIYIFFVCESCHLQFWVFFSFLGYACVCRIGTLRFSFLVVCVSLTIFFPCFMCLCPWLFFVYVSGVFNFCYLFIFNHVLLLYLFPFF